MYVSHLVLISVLFPFNFFTYNFSFKFNSTTMYIPRINKVLIIIKIIAGAGERRRWSGSVGAGAGA